VEARLLLLYPKTRFFFASSAAHSNHFPRFPPIPPIPTPKKGARQNSNTPNAILHPTLRSPAFSSFLLFALAFDFSSGSHVPERPDLVFRENVLWIGFADNGLLGNAANALVSIPRSHMDPLSCLLSFFVVLRIWSKK